MMMSAKSIPTPRKKNTVLAFDPGYERLGVAVIERAGGKDTLIFSDCVHTSASLPFADRLHTLGKEAERLINKFKPTVIALEKVYFEKNAKTAMQVGEVCGMLTYIATCIDLPVHLYTPLEVKVATTGYGKSDKQAMAHMVARLIALPTKKRLDDELDAIAVGLTCLASLRLPSR